MHNFLALLSEMVYNNYRLKNSTELLLTDATMIQVGNNDDAYWNGEEACEALKKILTQIERNKTLLDQLEKCAKLLKN